MEPDWSIALPEPHYRGHHREGGPVRVITCECGFVVRGDSDDELIANAREHLRTAHPEIAGKVTDEQFLAMAEVVG
jgi:Protein of unknown function (DUF1059)